MTLAFVKLTKKLAFGVLGRRPVSVEERAFCFQGGKFREEEETEDGCWEGLRETHRLFALRREEKWE